MQPTYPGYPDVVASWNTLVEHRPASAVAARSAQDVADAVRYARRHGYGVGVLATGHGAPAIGPDGVLVNTSAMNEVSIDPARRIATVGAGARWRDVHERSAEYGLTGVCGSSSAVGVVGFIQGGGFGWLSRRLGFASSSVRSAEIVTADGEIRVVDDHCLPDLLWAVAGGAGAFGIVTRLSFDLHRVGDDHNAVYGGNLYYPLARTRDVAEAFAAWAPRLPGDVMAALTLRRFPPLPTVPEPLRVQAVIGIRACDPGDDPGRGPALVDQVRRALGPPLVDSYTRLPATGLDPISADPPGPLPALQHGETLVDLGPGVIDRLVDETTDPAAFGFAMLELRRLGGAMRKAPRGPHPMARTTGAYSVNAVSVVPTPTDEPRVRERHRRFFAGLHPHLTGTTYLNFLDGDPARVRAAYDDADWARLVHLKARHDPGNLFRLGRTIPPADPHHHNNHHHTTALNGASA